MSNYVLKDFLQQHSRQLSNNNNEWTIINC